MAGPWEWELAGVGLERCQPMQVRDDDLRAEQLQVKLECRGKGWGQRR
jgi:hypothetical protein